MSLQHLTRLELYELVWSQPATKLAQQLGVSDVWISKVCKKANIPKPPPGYWQALAVGKKVARPALPASAPLQPDNVAVLGNDWNYRHAAYPEPQWTEPKTDEDPIPPLPPQYIFQHSMDDVRRHAELLTADITFSETLKTPHPATKLLLEGDRRREHDNAKHSYTSSWDKPRFRHPAGLILLTALNQLFTAWTSLGATVSITGRKYQSISVAVLGFSQGFYFTDYDWENDQTVGKTPKGESKYGFTWGRLDENNRYWSRKQHSTQILNGLTPAILRSIVKESILRAETKIRTSADDHYQWLITRRDNYIKEREKRRLAAIRRHEKEVQQLLQARMDLLDEASSRIAKADRLRSAIAAFDEKVGPSKEPIAGYDKWRRWATHQISQIDLRCMSSDHIAQWIAKFHLH